MKQNNLLFLVFFGLSFGLSLLFFRWRDASQEQQHIETIRLKLESDLNRLLKTRQIADIATVMQSNPVREHTRIEKLLDDGSSADQEDFEAYFRELIIISAIHKVNLKQLLWDAQGKIQTIVLTTEP